MVKVKNKTCTQLAFPDINRDCIPIFATSFQVRISDMYITRRQVPVSPAFALTEYKALGSTYQNALLDLSWPSKYHSEEKASHKQYCSVYVQLFRLQSKNGLILLQPLTFSDLNVKMHPKLHEEDCRLEQLASETMHSWLSG